MDTPIRFKFRQQHPDGSGRVFWCYMRGKEYWVDADKIEEKLRKKKEYSQSEKARAQRSRHSKANPASPEQIKYIQEWKKKKRQDPEWRKKEQAATARYNARPECKARRYEYMKGYRKRTNARLANNIRSRIRDVMKGKIKTDNTMKMLGCTAKEFMAHLQKHFERGMSFNNYGHFWSVDHVIPLARFDLTKPDHQKIAFHYTNTRPCWNDENIRKKDKLDHSLVTRHELAVALEMLK